MPWKETGVVDLRKQFIEEVWKKRMPLRQICEQFGISHKTGYKWRQRFFEGGEAGLVDRSRRLYHLVRAVREEVAEVIVQLRNAHPLWGQPSRIWVTKHSTIFAAASVSHTATP
jgi:putative transposase